MEKLLTYSIEDHEGVKVVNLSGSLSSQSRKEFELLVRGLTQRGSVIINMENMHAVTSSGLNALIDVSADARKRNKRVVLLGTKENLVRTIETLDFYEYFIFVESVEEGLTKIRYYT